MPSIQHVVLFKVKASALATDVTSMVEAVKNLERLPFVDALTMAKAETYDELDPVAQFSFTFVSVVNSTRVMSQEGRALLMLSFRHFQTKETFSATPR